MAKKKKAEKPVKESKEDEGVEIIEGAGDPWQMIDLNPPPMGKMVLLLECQTPDNVADESILDYAYVYFGFRSFSNFKGDYYSIITDEHSGANLPYGEQDFFNNDLSESRPAEQFIAWAEIPAFDGYARKVCVSRWAAQRLKGNPSQAKGSQ